jgi:uncharacterized protein DUF1353
MQSHPQSSRSGWPVGKVDRGIRRSNLSTRRVIGALGIILSIGTAGIQTGCGSGGKFGQFKGDVEARWLPDGRKMKLLTDFAYIDPADMEWDARAGSEVDGASIPQVFWSLIGGPFEGQYRNASIVHDVACQKRDHDWHLVHKMFYTACRCGGVSEIEAKLLYSAVYHFGPRWGPNSEPETLLSSDDDYERMQLMITTDPEVATAEIEKQTVMTLRNRIPVLPARPGAETLALPRLQRVFGAARGREVRLAPDARGLEFLMKDDAEASRIRGQLGQLRVTVTNQIDSERKDLLTKIAAEKDRPQRAALASQLLNLTRERAALNKVDVQVKVPH